MDPAGRDKSNIKKLVIGAAIGLGLGVLSYIGGQRLDDEPKGGTSRPGLEAVYTRIEGLTDCTALADEAEQASQNLELQERGSAPYEASLSYITVASQRSRDLGC